MIGVIAHTMWLGLKRDRGALLLAFVLPPLLFVVFAEVFSTAGDDDFALRVAWLDQADSERTQALGARLQELPGMARIRPDPRSVAELEQLVRDGSADAGVWIRREPGALLDAEPPIVVVGDAARALAAAVLTGRLQRLIAEAHPELDVARAIELVDALAGPYSAEQRARLDQAMAGLTEDPDAVGEAGAMLGQRMIGEARSLDPGVAYYAGAITILFLLFASFQGAISLIDERQAGIQDRLSVGPGGTGVVVLGKAVFLTVQGLAQAALIFAVAWMVYGLDWPAALLPWTITALAASASAAGLGLLLASACRSRQQAQTASAFAVLIVSAVGGSMMPRYLMPGWLRELGWLTPNAWAIDTWQAIFWRDAGWAALWPGWLALAGSAALALVAAVLLARRRALQAA